MSERSTLNVRTNAMEPLQVERTSLVKMQKDAGAVILRISFKLSEIGAEWAYNYVAKSRDGKSTIESGETSDGPVRIHSLGPAASLHLGAHEWDVSVARVEVEDDKEVDVAIVLAWEQDIDGDGTFETLHVREHNAKLDNENELVLFRSGVSLVLVNAVEPIKPEQIA